MPFNKDFVWHMDAFVKQLSKDEYEEQKSIEFEKLHILSAARKVKAQRVEEKKKNAKCIHDCLCQCKDQSMCRWIQISLGVRD
jgi:hypothetical protein